MNRMAEKLKSSFEMKMIAASVVWLLIWIVVVPYWYFYSYVPSLQDFPSVKVGDVGSYLSGIAAPLAFLWLVAGYFQQNRSINLQIEELRHSIDAQKSQATSMSEQLRLSLRNKFYPDFRLAQFEKSDDTIILVLENIGNRVYNLAVESLSDGLLLENSHQKTESMLRVEFREATGSFEKDDLKFCLTFLLANEGKDRICYAIENKMSSIGAMTLPALKKVKCGGEA